MKNRNTGKDRIQKTVKFDPADVDMIERFAKEEIRDFSAQVEYWVKEKIRERVERMREQADRGKNSFRGLPAEA